MLKKSEIKQIEAYLQHLFSNQTIWIKEGTGAGEAPAEVSVNGAFVGVVYKNEDEGEISYDFHMSILSEDL